MAAAIQPVVVASHSNSRELVPGNRQLSPEMARATAQGNGVIGLVGPSRSTAPGWHPGGPWVSSADWARHGQVFGWARVGRGCGVDGGFGVEGDPAG